MARDLADTVLEHWREAGAETGTLTQGPPPFFPEPPDDSGDGDRHGDDDGRPGPPLSNARLGMLMFLGAETMLFAGLIGSFLVFRVANQTWPPPTLPSLSMGITGINTLVLLCSAITMWCAQRAVRTGQHQRGVRFLSYTAFLGVAFLVIQGYEWVQLISYGLTMASGVYGATFYVLIGCHGFHVFGAVVWLLIGLLRTCRGHYSTTRYTGLALCSMYWYYVVALWPVLYWLVYLY
jgi:heme/copper-type cytochrome/quinol oxidase subunit 3